MRLHGLFILAAFAVVGCGGPKLVPVSGKVLHKGSGLTAGGIYLHPASGNLWTGERPSSVLETHGGFDFQTTPHGRGVPVGSWKVTLSPALANRVRRPELADPQKTLWTLEVSESGVKDHIFEVK
ncbi:MAG: hypothetical protein EBV06_15790 [Planctomycetia bacterium]|nr:hypothetical protein [Planctomycetia bacterium]